MSDIETRLRNVVNDMIERLDLPNLNAYIDVLEKTDLATCHPFVRKRYEALEENGKTRLENLLNYCYERRDELEEQIKQTSHVIARSEDKNFYVTKNCYFLESVKVDVSGNVLCSWSAVASHKHALAFADKETALTFASIANALVVIR